MGRKQLNSESLLLLKHSSSRGLGGENNLARGPKVFVWANFFGQEALIYKSKMGARNNTTSL